MAKRGKRKCLCDDNLLWGVSSTLNHEPDVEHPPDPIANPPPHQYVGCVKVRAKLAPFIHTYGKTSQGQTPQPVTGDPIFWDVPLVMGSSGAGDGQTNRI